MGIDRTAYNATVNDDSSNTVGSLVDKAFIKDVLLDPIDVAFTDRPGITTPTTTGTITAEPIPTGTGDLVTYHNNATLKTIQGMVAGLSGQRWTHYSKGAGQVDFAHQHASGTALGKLQLCATTGLTSLAAGSGVAVFQYDATLTIWRLVSHEQGALITPTYAAGAFTGSAGTWTVDAGDVTTYAYKLSGRNLKVWFSLSTTSVASAGAGLNIALPNGLACSGKTFISTFLYNDNAGATTVGQSEVDAGGVIIRLLKFGFGAWATATNTTAVFGMVDIETN